MEWGAVTYLSRSKYGANEEIWNNPIYPYKTGCAETGVNASNESICNSYNTENGQKASTTHNIYGIYDMSGGAYEYVMGGMYSDGTKTKLLQGFAEFTEKELTLTSEDFIGSKYIDKYTYGTLYGDYSRRKLGDATGETMGWYGDYADFVYSSGPWFSRGGNFYDGTGAGAFAFNSYNGDSSSDSGFRLAVSGVFPSA